MNSTTSSLPPFNPNSGDGNLPSGGPGHRFAKLETKTTSVSWVVFCTFCTASRGGQSKSCFVKWHNSVSLFLYTLPREKTSGQKLHNRSTRQGPISESGVRVSCCCCCCSVWQGSQDLLALLRARFSHPADDDDLLDPARSGCAMTKYDQVPRAAPGGNRSTCSGVQLLLNAVFAEWRSSRSPSVEWNETEVH